MFMCVHICMCIIYVCALCIMYVQYLHMHRKMYAFGKRQILEESEQIGVSSVLFYFFYNENI